MSPNQISISIVLAAASLVAMVAILIPLALRQPNRAAAVIEKSDKVEAAPIRMIPMQRKQSAAEIPTSSPPPVPPVLASPTAPAPLPQIAEPNDSAPAAHPDNICARTGGWKVEIRGGRSWRCAYRR